MRELDTLLTSIESALDKIETRTRALAAKAANDSAAPAADEATLKKLTQLQQHNQALVQNRQQTAKELDKTLNRLRLLVGGGGAK